MVNFARFGPLTSPKPVAVVDPDLSPGDKGCKMKLIAKDVEACNLLPVFVESSENRSKKHAAGRWCCMACVADVCVVVALLLIFASTGLLLYKVWWVKKEVDRIQPTVAQLKTDLNRLQAAAQIDADLNGIYNDKSIITPGVDVSPFQEQVRIKLKFVLLSWVA